MSIEDTTVDITYNANGAQVDFSIPFAFLDVTHVKCDHYEGTTGLIEVLSYPTEYTISGTTLTTISTYPTGDKVTVYRQTPKTQGTELEEQGVISADVLEEMHDKGTYIDQEDNTSRYLKVPVGETVEDIPSLLRRANKLAGYDTNGDPSVYDGVSDVPVSSAMEPVVTAGTLADARTELDVYSKSEAATAGHNHDSDYADIATETPSGGATGTVLRKDSATNYDTSWSDIKTEILGAVFPVGSIYTQYPGQATPSTLGYPGTWTNISSDYAGVFFRAEGGDADTFDTSLPVTAQTDQFQGHGHQFRRFKSGINTYQNKDRATLNALNNVQNTLTDQEVLAPTANGGNGTPRTGSETRPTNVTIRIWERTT